MAMYIHTNIFLLAFFAITVILFSSNMVVGRRCQGERDLMSQCEAFVKKDGSKGISISNMLWCYPESRHSMHMQAIELRDGEEY